MKKTFALAAGLLMSGIFSSTAIAKDWWVLDGQSGECKSAATFGPARSPEEFHEGLRNEGVTDQVRVRHDDDGSVSMVAISSNDHGQQVSILWFPNETNCTITRDYLRRKGLLPNLNELR